MKPFHRKKLILASQSPRRQQLLAERGVVFRVIPADDAVETPYDPALCESPSSYVLREARLKAENVARHFPVEDLAILACDTVAVCEGEILGKPVDRDDARRMLEKLSGTRHQVISGLCFLNPAQSESILCETVSTTLEMNVLTPEQLESYLESGLWRGKAGAFGYQDGNDWHRVLEGSEANVVGLPIERVMEILTPDENWI